MGKFIDLTGQVFGYLLVLERAEKRGKHTMWRCRCLKCGNECVVPRDDLKRQKTCGCGRKKHGMHGTPIYRTWQHMLQRCENPKCKGFDQYGGRGIKVCPRWHDFTNFYDDVSKMKHFGAEGYTLDRENVNGDYCPENCRWVTMKEQQNNRRDNVKVEYNGEEMTLSQAAEKSGISYYVLQKRHHVGKRGDDLFAPIENNSIIVEYEDEKMCLKDAAKFSGINYQTLYTRYQKGLRGEELFAPVKKTKPEV